MSVCKRLSLVAISFGLVALLAPLSKADPIPEKYQKTIDKGLEWLKKTQGQRRHLERGGAKSSRDDLARRVGHAHGREHRYPGEIPR